MPNHSIGDLLLTIAMSGLSRVRTELLRLAVVAALTPHPVQMRRSPPEALRNRAFPHRRNGTGALSLQVLQEYFVTVTRKLSLDARVARRKVELLSEFDVAAPDVSDILAAIDLHRLHAISFWDALVLRSAKQAGCRVLLSEDMQAAREIDGIQIVNPFT
jgi:predicted nucleic acid-binding protein